MFELAWRGGATAARLHARRPGIEQMPWGTIVVAAAHDIEARRIWTTGVFTEYASAAAFSELTTAMLACGAPIDLIAASADIAVDELFHVELSARLTMELGGAVPLHFDLANVAPKTTPGIRPLLRAAEIAIVTSCVSESLSVPAMARSKALATEPLVQAVMTRLLADEGQHARLGFWFFDWANDALTADERAHLAKLAIDAVEVYAQLWQGEGHDETGKADLRAAVTQSIATPLARYGIALDPARVAALVA
jgi:hypothetical protein